MYFPLASVTQLKHTIYMDRFSYYSPISTPDRNEDGSFCYEPTSGHDCLDFVVFHSCQSVEPHGERFQDDWYECSLCHEKYTTEELDAMYRPVMIPILQPITVRCAKLSAPEFAHLDQEVA